MLVKDHLMPEIIHSKTKNTKSLVLFCIILVIGIFLRTWQYTKIPAGFHQDEIGQGIDAYDVMYFDYDRNGMSYPLQFITWGDGQTALYIYLIMPFLKLLGPCLLAIRLPNLIAGIILIPIVYLIGKQLISRDYGLLVMFLMAISPWHIIGSRWGLEPYFLPFLFSIGFYFLLISEFKNSWLIIASICFGLCLYTYSTAYAAVPTFLGLIVLVLFIYKVRMNRYILISGAIIILMAVPVGLFLLINFFDLPTIYLGRFSIPHLTTEARFIAQTGIGSSSNSLNILMNLQQLWKVLWSQTDGWPRNVIEPYGYLYPGANLLFIAGIILMLTKHGRHLPIRFSLLIVWFIASIPIGILQKTNFNRVCLIFMPILFIVGYTLAFIWKKFPVLRVIGIGGYLLGIVLFTIAYHSSEYAASIENDFKIGLIDAIEYARDYQGTPICFSKSINTSYVYVLWVEKPDPRSYITKLGTGINMGNPFASYSEMSRYVFRENHCPMQGDSIWIIPISEADSRDALGYKRVDFNDFIVLVPSNEVNR
jgi:hypothetical protein